MGRAAGLLLGYLSATVLSRHPVLCIALPSRAAHVGSALLPRYEEKDLFKEFMEDYNTATLPSRKYYNLEKWEAEQRAKRAKKVRRSRAAGGSMDPCVPRGCALPPPGAFPCVMYPLR